MRQGCKPQDPVAKERIYKIEGRIAPSNDGIWWVLRDSSRNPV